MLNAIREDINKFKEEKQVDRVVMLWAASTEIFIEVGPQHQTIEAFEAAIDANDPCIAPSMLYAYAAILEGVPFANGAPNLSVDVPALTALAIEKRVPISGKDFKTGQTLIKTVIGPMLRSRMLGLSGWYSTNILGNRDGEVLDDPDNFKTKEESKLGVLEHILDPVTFPDLYGDVYHKVRINYYPPRGDNKEGWDNIDIFGWLGYPMQLKIDFLCRDTTASSPRRSRWTSSCSATSPSAPACTASRSGSASTTRRRWWHPACMPSTTCSCSRASSRTRCAG